MKEQLISFETAKLAKEKGFDWKCDAFSYGKDNVTNDILVRVYEDEKDFYEMPTQSLLQKWLREKHKLNIEIGMQYKVWFYSINKLPYNSFDDSDIKGGTKFNTYEEALEEGLLNALKLIK